MNDGLREVLRIGRCGPISRAAGRAAARTRLPGSELVAFGLLGKPRHGAVEVDVVRDGLRWHLDLRDDAHRLLFLDLYETELRHRVLASLPVGGRFVDVGANVGFWSVPAARRAGPGGVVRAFEPNPWAAGLLRRNADANAAGSAPVELTQAAVGEAAGTLTLYAADLEAFASQATAHPADDASASVEVPVVALDDVIEGPVDVLKIDVEGHELAVLDGAARLLGEQAVATVVIEIQDALLRRAGHSAEALAQRLEGLGYVACDGDGALGTRPTSRPLPDGFYETVVWRPA